MTAFEPSEEHKVTTKPIKSRGPGALARVWLPGGLLVIVFR
jgi:hypothetical protein